MRERESASGKVQERESERAVAKGRESGEDRVIRESAGARERMGERGRYGERERERELERQKERGERAGERMR